MTQYNFPYSLVTGRRPFCCQLHFRRLKIVVEHVFILTQAKIFSLTHINNLLQYHKGITLILSDESQTAKNRRPLSVVSMTQTEKESPRSDMMIGVGSLLHTAAVCDLDNMLLQLCYNCLEGITNATHQLDVFVPHGVHLPSPPLYCPQPSVDQSVSIDLLY